MKLVKVNNDFYLEDNKKLNEITKLENAIVEIPYYYNIHSHLGENLYRDIDGDGWSISKYLEYVFSITKSLSKEQLQEKTEQSFNEVVQYSKDNMIAGICASRSAFVCDLHNLNNLAGYPIMKVEQRSEYLNNGLNGFLEYKNKYENDSCIVGVSIHSLYTNTEKELEFAKLCVDNGAKFVTIHVSEDLETRAKEIEIYNSKPIATLKRYGLLSENTIIVHCGHLDDDDLKLVQEYNATLVLCPISNVFLNTRIVDVYKLDELKINWCIATDGLATGRTFSMEEQSLLVKKIFKKISYKELYDRCSFTPREFFKNLDSYNNTIKIRVSCNNKEELFSNIINKNFELI